MILLSMLVEEAVLYALLAGGAKDKGLFTALEVHAIATDAANRAVAHPGLPPLLDAISPV